MKLKGIDDKFIRDSIIGYLQKFNCAKKNDFEQFLITKISDSMNEDQKKNKIKNILQALKKHGKIINVGKQWKLK